MLDLAQEQHQCFVSEDLFPESELLQCYTTWKWLHKSKIDTFVNIMTDLHGWNKEESDNVKAELTEQLKNKHI